MRRLCVKFADDVLLIVQFIEELGTGMDLEDHFLRTG
jgi:hypothetical protein